MAASSWTLRIPEEVLNMSEDLLIGLIKLVHPDLRLYSLDEACEENSLLEGT